MRRSRFAIVFAAALVLVGPGAAGCGGGVEKEAPGEGPGQEEQQRQQVRQQELPEATQGAPTDQTVGEDIQG